MELSALAGLVVYWASSSSIALYHNVSVSQKRGMSEINQTAPEQQSSPSEAPSELQGMDFVMKGLYLLGQLGAAFLAEMLSLEWCSDTFPDSAV